MVGLTEMLSCKNLDRFLLEDSRADCIRPFFRLTPASTRAQLDLLCPLYYLRISNCLKDNPLPIGKNNLKPGTLNKAIQIMNKWTCYFNQMLGFMDFFLELQPFNVLASISIRINLEIPASLPGMSHLRTQLMNIQHIIGNISIPRLFD